MTGQQGVTSHQGELALCDELTPCDDCDDCDEHHPWLEIEVKMTCHKVTRTVRQGHNNLVPQVSEASDGPHQCLSPEMLAATVTVRESMLCLQPQCVSSGVSSPLTHKHRPADPFPPRPC